jgi:signal transduction histidine kinase
MISRTNDEVPHRLANDLGYIPLRLRRLIRALDRGDLDLDAVKRDLGDMSQSVRTVLKLAHELQTSLDELKEKGHQALSPVVIPVNALLDVALETRPRLRREIEFLTEIPPELGAVNVVPQHIATIVNEFISNAQKAISGHGTITLRAREIQDQISIEVQDTGKGILRSEIDKIFSMSYTTTNGRGFGLFDAMLNAKLNGGEIPPPISELNVGTTFALVLPKHSTPETTHV